MALYLNDKGYTCYVRSGITLSDTHGSGHAETHLREFEDVCNRITDEKINRALEGLQGELPQIITDVCAGIWNQVARETLAAFTQETHTVVNIAFDDGLDILRSEKTRRFITD